MKYVPLVEFCTGFGKKAVAARLMKVTPAAIGKMLAEKRRITLVFDDAGEYIDYIELKIGSDAA